MRVERDRITGVILAGGLSRRMGGTEKALLELDGRPLMAHVIERLCPQATELLINANGDHSRFDQYKLPVQADTVEGFAGPLAGILAGMRWCENNAHETSHILTAAADTPFFPLDLMVRLMQTMDTNQAEIALAASGGRNQPVFGLWSVTLADELERFLVVEQLTKVMQFVERYPYCAVEFDRNGDGASLPDPFFNINTPQDIDRAQLFFAGDANRVRRTV